MEHFLFPLELVKHYHCALLKAGLSKHFFKSLGCAKINNRSTLRSIKNMSWLSPRIVPQIRKCVMGLSSQQQSTSCTISEHFENEILGLYEAHYLENN